MTKEKDRPNLDPRFSEVSQLSRLTSELSDQGHSAGEDDVGSKGESEIHCRHCGSEEFKVRFAGEEKVFACGRCGRRIDEKDDGGKEKVAVGDSNAYRKYYT